MSSLTPSKYKTTNWPSYSTALKQRGSISIWYDPGIDLGAAAMRYHRRSRVESKMNCIKLLGQSLMARDFDRQVEEIQVRVAVLNRYTALGIPVTEQVE